MAKLFGKQRSTRTNLVSSSNGLSDATNFPLLSTKYQQQTTSNHFSARRLLCFGGGGDRRNSGVEPVSPSMYNLADPKSISPTQDVANAWVGMASNEAVETSLSTNPSSHHSRSRTRPVTTDHRRVQYCGSRRVPPQARPKNSTSASRTTRTVATHSKPHHRSRTTKQQRSVVMASEWMSAVDPKSGRTYYYNVRTRETQWRKPMELASPTEQKEMAAKEKKQRDFFAVMEANILKSMAQGQVPGTPQLSTPSPTDDKKKKVPNRPRKSLSIPKPRMVRTISGMDDAILKQLVQRVPSMRASNKLKLDRAESLDVDDLGRMHDEGHLSDLSEESLSQMTDSSLNMAAMEISLSDLNFDMDEDSPSAQEENRALRQLAQTAAKMRDASGSRVNSPEEAEEAKVVENKSPPKLERPSLLEKPGLGSRRNTCGTIYVGSTMSAPDKDATIKCVCGVYRAHILSSAKEEAHSSFSIGRSDAKYRIFNDREIDRLPAGTVREDVEMVDASLEAIVRSVPTLDEITDFYRDVFRRAQMESDCIIMSLIYVERLIKTTDGGLRPRPSNWRSLLFSCMILSSKVWDDLSMWNADFSQTCPAGVRFSLQRINELEVAVLNALNYKVKVPASEYAKYYFLLRSMLIKSGLGGEDIKSMNPLDVEGAKKLEQVSSSFQSTAATKRRIAQEDRLRSKSMGHVDVAQMAKGAAAAQKGPRETKASLEHMVKM